MAKGEKTKVPVRTPTPGALGSPLDLHKSNGSKSFPFKSTGTMFHKLLHSSWSVSPGGFEQVAFRQDELGL